MPRPDKLYPLFSLSILALLASVTGAIASDWDEDIPKQTPAKKAVHNPPSAVESHSSSEPAASDMPSETPQPSFTGLFSPSEKGTAQSTKPLEGKIEKSHSNLRIQRQEPTLDSSQQERLETKAIDDELRGSVNDSALRNMNPSLDNSNPLSGRAALDGKPGRFADPDEDDAELLVEWDRWHNRFLRAVQLGTQENVNNPDPEDYERPRVDPRTGAISRSYPLGTGAAFSCIVTEDGHIKNLEIFEPSGFPKYDKAVLRAVQALEGTQILRFPKGSHRRTVMQPGRIKTATSSDFKFHHFGDVERVRN